MSTVEETDSATGPLASLTKRAELFLRDQSTQGERNSQSVLKISGDSLGWDVYCRIIQAGRDLRLDHLIQPPIPSGSTTFPGNLR